jgi:dihydroxyacetone kinase-like protein
MAVVNSTLESAEAMLFLADRDLGIKRGMEAVKAPLEPMERSGVEQVFVTTRTAMMASMALTR